MILKKFDIGGGTLLVELASSDCGLLAQLAHQAQSTKQIEDLALLFSLASVACEIYAATDAKERAQEALLQRLKRCSEPLE